MGKETGFPSPAQGYEAKSVDLNKEIVKNPPATYFMRYESADLLYLGIFPDSKLVIDRSVKPKNNSIVVFAHEDKFRCRQWLKKGKTAVLVNSQGDELVLNDEVCIFGVVTTVIRNV